MNYRDLLDKLERDEERVRDENEFLRLDAEAETLAKDAERELRQRLGADIPGNAVRAVLPANADPLVPQDPSRRAEFAQHLEEILEEAVLDQARLESDPVEAAPGDALSASICTACRGSCCRAGEDHAYLTAQTMVRALQAHPDWSVARITDAYLSCLPSESVANSCIYHSATGCGLPRALRSSTCNRYLCGKLKNLVAALPGNNPPAILAVMFDKGQWARTALIAETGVRILAESDSASG